ncbi:hypothetical protein TNCV_2684661 [Trichonephila clavipes]|nr:hypothetical protein TNCV_2684661 [Trichonephila clavipes]
MLIGPAVVRSAIRFTISHPESELTTTKENPKCCKQTKKQRLKTVKRKNNECDAFQYLTQVFFWNWLVIAAHSYSKKAVKREREKEVQFVIQSSVHSESLWGVLKLQS